MLTTTSLLMVLALCVIPHAFFHDDPQKRMRWAGWGQRALIVCVLGIPCFLALWLGVVEMGNGMRLAGLTVACGGAGLVLTIVLLIRRPKVPGETENYLANSRHCGRCGYDLTGNVSGVCPECGWALPTGFQPPGVNPLESPQGQLKRGVGTAALRSATLFVLALGMFRPIRLLMDSGSLCSDPIGLMFLFLVLILFVLLLRAAMAWIRVARIASCGRREGGAVPSTKDQTR